MALSRGPGSQPNLEFNGNATHGLPIAVRLERGDGTVQQSYRKDRIVTQPASMIARWSASEVRS